MIEPFTLKDQLLQNQSYLNEIEFQKIDIEKTIYHSYPKISKLPNSLKKLLIKRITELAKEKELNDFLKKNYDKDAFEFVEAVLDEFNFGYKVSIKEIENIPSLGGTVVVANHPIGSFDLLALVSLIKQVRSDVKIIATEILSQVTPLKSILIPLHNADDNIDKKTLKEIDIHLKNEGLVIVFPASEVSRVQNYNELFKIKDGIWKKGFIRFAKRNNASIIPIYIKAKNSKNYYFVSMFSKRIGTFLLAKEMFKQRNKTIEFRIGELISLDTIAKLKMDENTLANLIKRQLYMIPKNKETIFETSKSIARPEKKYSIRKEIKSSFFLGKTKDNKEIYLFNYFKGSSVIKEIGRLREYTFRKVNEGTGAKRDIDKYDKYYQHILLWDDEELELIGSYRVGNGEKILSKFGVEGLYTSTLFKINNDFLPRIKTGLELGRSFIQPKYWGTRALDYLWQGIGAYVRFFPEVKYLFGAVSISDSYPKIAKSAIIYYYSKYFTPNIDYLTEINPFFLNEKDIQGFIEAFDGNDKKKDYFLLKDYLSSMNLSVPTLFKHYANLSDIGVEFLGFNIDPNFSMCVDGMICLKINELYPDKYKRYFN